MLTPKNYKALGFVIQSCTSIGATGASFRGLQNTTLVSWLTLDLVCLVQHWSRADGSCNSIIFCCSKLHAQLTTSYGPGKYFIFLYCNLIYGCVAHAPLRMKTATRRAPSWIQSYKFALFGMTAQKLWHKFGISLFYCWFWFAHWVPRSRISFHKS